MTKEPNLMPIPLHFLPPGKMTFTRTSAALLSVICTSLLFAADPDVATELTLADVAAGKAEIIDLTYPLNEESNFWPGPGYAPFHIETIATLEKNGVYSRTLSFPEHIGTHLDAPNHFEPDQPDVSQILPEQFFAPGVVIDLTLKAEKDPDVTLTLKDIQDWEAKHGEIPRGAIVIMNSGWGAFWLLPERFQNRDARGQLHFPGFSPEAAQWLIDNRDIKGIGVDTLSIDPGISKKFEVHHIMNGAKRYGLENLAHLSQLPSRDFFLIVAPIKVQGGTGGPCRVFAILPR